MTTAREQAREAAVALFTHDDTYYAAGRHERTGAVRGADAASDVWEPLLREVRQCPVKFKGVNKGQPYLAVEVPTELWLRIKEALDV